MAQPKQASKMRVKQIYTYPIKSLRGIAAPTLTASYSGFAHDRIFMLRRVADAKNMHVSDFTEMCLFTTAITEFSEAGEGGLIQVRYALSHVFDHPETPLKKGKEVLEVPLRPDVRGMGLREVQVVVHSSPARAFDMGGEYNAWLSERFGYAVQLVYIGENKRPVLGNMPPNIAGRQLGGGEVGLGLKNDVQAAGSRANANGEIGWLGTLTAAAGSVWGGVVGGGGENKENEAYDGVDIGISFAECAPFLVISTKSWENAQKRLPEGEVMDISKFRPNIIVEGADEEFEEDYWGELQIGKDAKIVLTQNCARCNSLNVDYNTGKVAGGEAGKILKKLQSDRRVDMGAKWSPIFGRYGFLARLLAGKPTVEIKAGDEVSILRRNDRRTRFEWPNLSTNS